MGQYGHSDFDYSWHHDVAEPPYIYQFGTQHQKTGGPRYTVEGATDVKFVGDITSTARAVAQRCSSDKTSKYRISCRHRDYKQHKIYKQLP